MAEPSPKSKSSKKAKKKAAAVRGEDVEDIEALKSDVASFASSLGLVAGAGNPSGFDDSDFRKSGPIKPLKPSKQPDQTSDVPQNTANSEKPKPAKKTHPLELHVPQAGSTPGATTNYPLMKAAALSGQWYTDAEELEAKVLGNCKQMPPAVGLQEMQQLVARKRELAGKLMAQYAWEYDKVRRGKGDLKLLEMSAKSGTSADKVSAFTCLVEDNPIANIRALDSLVGELHFCNVIVGLK
jgi:ribosome biogenesis protein MAK21